MLILSTPRTAQPNGAVGTSKRTPRLEFAWNGAMPTNASSNALMTLSLGGVTPTVGSKGKGYAFAGGANTGKLIGTIQNDTPEVTFVFTISNINSAAGGSGLGRIISTYNGSGGNDVFTQDVNLVVLQQIFSTTSAIHTVPAPTSSTPSTYVVTMYGTTATPVVYRDGARVTPALVTGASGSRVAGGLTVNVGARPDVTTRQLAGNVYRAALISGTIPELLMRDLSLNPDLLWASANDRRYWAAAAAPTGVPYWAFVTRGSSLIGAGALH